MEDSLSLTVLKRSTGVFVFRKNCKELLFCKCFSHFCDKNGSVLYIKRLNFFYVSLNIDVVSFEKLGPILYVFSITGIHVVERLVKYA